MKPTIGITLDYQQEGSFSPRPHYAIRDSYFNAVTKAGGVPLGIAYQPELIDEFLARIDALVVPGGDFGLNPSWYVNDDKPGFASSPRLAFDVLIIKHALEKKIPVLGICAGMQILGGMHGCKLTSDIMAYIKTSVDHLKGFPAEKYAHDVNVVKGSLLHKIVGAEVIPTNSRHKEAIVEGSEQVKITGRAIDGVVEAIEVLGHEFALGVQWHPEFFIQEDEPSFAIFQALVAKAGK